MTNGEREEHNKRIQMMIITEQSRKRRKKRLGERGNQGKGEDKLRTRENLMKLSSGSQRIQNIRHTATRSGVAPTKYPNNVNNGKRNIPDRDDWETPQWLFEKLDKQYNFDFDCCANELNHKTPWYSKNFKLVRMIGPQTPVSWMNPPFSKAKEMFKHFFQVVTKGVAIYRCDNLKTKIWQKIILPKADWIFIPNKRINYEGMKGKGSRFPSALIGIRVDSIKNIEGITLMVKQNVK